MSTTVPRFGPTEAPKYRRIPFEFAYLRDETVESQSFNLLAKPMDIGVANRMLSQSKGDNEAEAIPALIALIAKFMDDKDGTGARWKPVELPPKKNEDPPVKRFRGPDGKLHEWAESAAFLELAAGSSRRRWLHLLIEDEECSVDVDALVKLLEFLVEIAGKGHTPA